MGGFFGRALGAAAQGYGLGQRQGEGEAHRRAQVDKQNELRQAALDATVAGRRDTNAATLERERLREKSQADEAIRKHAASVEHDINKILTDPEQQANLAAMPGYHAMLMDERARARSVLIGQTEPSTWTPRVPHPDHAAPPPGAPPAGPSPAPGASLPPPGAAPLGLGAAPWSVFAGDGRTLTPPDLQELPPGARIATPGGAIAPETADIVQRLPGLAPAFSGVDPNASSGETEIPLPHGVAPVESPLDHYQRLVREGPPKFVQGANESAKQFSTRKQREGFLWKQQVQAAKDAALAGPKVQRLQTDADFARELDRQKVAGMQAGTIEKRSRTKQNETLGPIRVQKEKSTIQHQRVTEQQAAGRQQEQARHARAVEADNSRKTALSELNGAATRAHSRADIERIHTGLIKSKDGKMSEIDRKAWDYYSKKATGKLRGQFGKETLVPDSDAVKHLETLRKKYAPGTAPATTGGIGTGGGAATPRIDHSGRPADIDFEDWQDVGGLIEKGHFDQFMQAVPANHPRRAEAKRIYRLRTGKEWKAR